MQKFDTKFPYFNNDLLEIVGLPMEGNDTIMYFILPKNDKFNLNKLIKQVNGKEFSNLISQMRNVKVEVKR